LGVTGFSDTAENTVIPSDALQGEVEESRCGYAPAATTPERFLDSFSLARNDNALLCARNGWRTRYEGPDHSGLAKHFRNL
jgi:hypothetical protein